MNELYEALYDARRNAILSWQGYHYQGMVALQCFLEELVRRYNISEDEAVKLKLKIEWVEDFILNYQNELQRIKENYSGKEYDRQLAILDKAYEEIAQSVSRGYAKQLKMLSGDIVIKTQTGISYSSEAEVEKAYQGQTWKRTGNVSRSLIRGCQIRYRMK